VAGANAFVIKDQILTIVATVPHHIQGEYLLEDDDSDDKVEDIFLIFSIMKNCPD
jgi:hypothetical protein